MSSKGGHRPGSGRKPKDPSEVRVTRAFRLLPALSAALDQLADQRGCGAAQVLEDMIAREARP